MLNVQDFIGHYITAALVHLMWEGGFGIDYRKPSKLKQELNIWF